MKVGIAWGGSGGSAEWGLQQLSVEVQIERLRLGEVQNFPRECKLQLQDPELEARIGAEVGTNL